ncbi:MAG: 2-phosphosulfolactate phosphatase [Salinirussus sp.]
MSETIQGSSGGDLIPRREALPTTLPAGHYVVIDVFHFSNTVIELVNGGASAINIRQPAPGDDQQTNALIGGEPTAEYEPQAGADFFNSPSVAADLDVAGRNVVFWSANGGRTVATLRDRSGSDIDIWVGSTLNARAVADRLVDSHRPVYLVAAGRRGQVALEDVLGARLIDRYLAGQEPSPAERATLRNRLETARGESYLEQSAIRRQDVLEYATNLDGRTVVPRLVDGALVAD